MWNDAEPAIHSANSACDSRDQEMPSAPSGTLIRMTNGRITTWSLDMERRYGFSGSEALGQKPHCLLRTTFPRALQQIETTLVCENRWSGVLLHRHADGRVVITANHWYLHRDAGNQPCLISEVHADITEDGKKTRDQLAGVLAALAHEMTQPLTAINLYVDRAQRILESAWPDLGSLRQAMVLASGQIVRSAEAVHLLRDLAIAMRDTD